MNNAYKTAISRNKPSAPMAWLQWAGLLKGKKLDYGCGRGFDADFFFMEKYDPHFFRCDDFCENEFDTITCNFVLNVIEHPGDRAYVINRILRWLKPDGRAYITIRSDINNLKGYTKIGTWQGYVPPNEPLFHRGRGYEMYLMKK